MNFFLKHRGLFLLLLIMVFSIGFRLLDQYQFSKSGVFYIGFPFLIAIALAAFTRRFEVQHNVTTGWKRKYWNHFRDATIVMLGSSIVLFEGFICVVMFMPIYYGVMLVTFVLDGVIRATSKRRGRIPVHILPALALFFSLEGITPNLSFDRNDQVHVSKIVNADVETIRRNLHRPIEIPAERDWFLQLFPMPYNIIADSWNEGDIHRVDFRYHRWFFTNTHEGSMHLQLNEVNDTNIKARFVEDTSYISTYMSLQEAEIKIESLEQNKTRISLTIKFERNLDPAWYFGPLEHHGVQEMALHLLDEVLTRE